MDADQTLAESQVALSGGGRWVGTWLFTLWFWAVIVGSCRPWSWELWAGCQVALLCGHVGIWMGSQEPLRVVT